MTDPPPTHWPPPDVPIDPSPAGRWQHRSRWVRWSAHAVGVVVGLSVIVALVEEPDADESTRVPPTIIGEQPEFTAPLEGRSIPTSNATFTTTTSTTTPTSPSTSPSTSTPTTSSSTTATTVPGSRLALDVLATIPVENERQDGYDRDLFAYGTTADGRGCRTRALVLMRDSSTPAQVDPVGCAVVAGDWFSAYDAATRSDPSELEVDHVVALQEAWDSGAWGWTPERRAAFGNDLDDRRSLRAVTGSVNQAKGAADPSNWIPPDPAFVCTYLADWVAIKARWGLSMDQSEHGRIRNLLTARCPLQPVEPWPDTPPPGPPVTIAPVLPLPAPLPVRPSSGTCDVSYPDVCIPPSPPDLNCADITERRFRVLPPDPHRFDGDGDGIGCES